MAIFCKLFTLRILVIGYWHQIYGPTSEVTVYDSLFTTVNTYTKNLLERLLKNKNMNFFLVHPQIQDGCDDCGLFTLAFCGCEVQSKCNEKTSTRLF